MEKLYEEAKIDDNTWDGVTKKDIVEKEISKKEEGYFSNWWSYFGW